MDNQTLSLVEHLKERVSRADDYLDLPAKQEELKSLEEDMAQTEFWQRSDTQDVINQVKSLKLVIEPWGRLKQKMEDLCELVELVQMEDDPSLGAEIAKDAKALDQELSSEELKTLLSDEADTLNAFVSINAGAGGTESCDWASMLLRMYTRWAESHNFSVQTIDHLPGEEAGIKNVTILVKGAYAYGYLKCEIGVHRLVRISPFDANKKRHTSFVSVDVSPEIDDNFDLEIAESEIRVDTYRAGGAGGQHVNKTDSAVRMTHEPTGIVVQCQNERSQHKNRAAALKMLKSRLYELERRKKMEQSKQAYDEKGEIAWGNQIRSYVYQPYTMVKDHRTKHQTGNIIAVMDGQLDEFIEAFLQKRD